MKLERKIAQLEALAASTTFPAERETALGRAAALRAKLGKTSGLDPVAKARLDRHIQDLAHRRAAALRAHDQSEADRQAAMLSARDAAVAGLRAIAVEEDADLGTIWLVPGWGRGDLQHLYAAWLDYQEMRA